MTDLRAKFDELREFVLTIPPEKLDMRYVIPRVEGCGCIMYHRYDLAADIIPAITEGEQTYLFDDGGSKVPSAYDEPTGQPAKDEFLRRLDVLKNKYCPSSTENTES